MALGGGVRRALAEHCLDGLEVEAMPGVFPARRGWRWERRAFRSGGSAGGVTGRPRDPSGSASSCPGESRFRVPAPSPACSCVRVAAKELAAVASRPAAWSAVPSGPGTGQGGCRLRSEVRRRAGQVGPRAAQGVCGVLVAASGRTTGPGMLGGAACHRARAVGQRLALLSGLSQNHHSRLGEISSVIRVTGAICSGRAMVRGRS